MSRRGKATADPLSHTARWWATENKVMVRLSAVRDFCVRCFCAVNMPEEKAVFTVEGFLEKDMQGDHLRGVNHVVPSCQQMEEGTVDPDPPLQVLMETSATALVNGDGFLYCVGYDAMRLCMEKAKHHGIGMVGVRAQLGMLAPFLKMAQEEHLIAFGTIQGPPVIAPTDGVEPIIGNNPTGFAFPTGQMLPVVLDAAFSQTSVSPVAAAASAGRKVPPGLLLNREGNPTQDPCAVASVPQKSTDQPEYVGWRYGTFQGGGSLVPIGGYKGYAFALTFGLLTTILTGPRTPLGNLERGWHYDRPGSLFICMDPGAFGPVEEFEVALDEYLQMVTGSLKCRGAESIMYPGQMSARAIQQHRAADTLPLTPQVLASLQEYACHKGMSLGV